MRARGRKTSTGCETIRVVRLQGGNLSDHFTQIAIQGPKGVNLLQKLTDADLSAVKFYWVARGMVCGLKNILIARTGYTAEDGFEIYVPADEATSAMVWDRVLEAGKEFGAVACGLDALTRCRWKAVCRSTGAIFRCRRCLGSGAGPLLQDGKGRSLSGGRRSKRPKPWD